MYFDDFWVGDSAEEPPFGQIVRLAPTAGGPISWDNSGGYIRVDEITPLGGANEENIHTGINDATEYYELQDIADFSATINAVKAMWQMKRGPGQDSDHRFAWYEGGFFGDSGPLVLSQKGYAAFSRIFATAPSGGPWDVLKLAAFQIGARHVSGPQDTYISWASAMVDYKKSY